MGNPEGMQVATYISHLPKDSERREITVMSSDKCKFLLNTFASTRSWEKRGTDTNSRIKCYFSLCRVE